MKLLLSIIIYFIAFNLHAEVIIITFGSLKTQTAFGGIKYKVIETKSGKVFYLTKNSSLYVKDCHDGVFEIVKTSPLANENAYELNNYQCND